MRAIDSSALVKYFSREAGWEKVRELIIDGVITLDLAVKELANALWKKALRGELSIDVAKTILRDLVEEGAIPLEKQEKYILKAFEIAVRYNVTVYDALFMAFAKENSLELITSDKIQADLANRIGVKAILA